MSFGIALVAVEIVLEAVSIYLAVTAKSPIGGPKLSDLQVTASTYGSPVKEGWGVFRIGGNIIWSSLLMGHGESSGKGGGNDVYQYTWSGAVGLLGTDTTGPIGDILRIWADTKLVFDKTGATNGNDSQYGLPQTSGKGGVNGTGGQGPNGSWYNNVGTFRILYGTQNQMPDPVMEQLFGADNCNANRGQAFIVFDNVNLINYGNRVPNWTFELAASGTSQNQLGQAIQWNTEDTVVGDVGTKHVALDPFRQQAYFFSPGNSGTAGIKVVDLLTRKEVAWYTFDQIFPYASAGQNIGADNQIWSACVGEDGYLYMSSAEIDNFAPISKIDPDGMVEVGVFGSSGGSGEDGPGQFTSSDTLFPMTIFGMNYLVALGYDDVGSWSLGLIETDSMTNPTGVIIANVVDNPGALASYVTGEAISQASVNLYGIVYQDGGATSVTLQTVVVSPAFGLELEEVGTIVPSDVDPGWTVFEQVGGLIFDQTDGNVLCFFKGNGGTYLRYLCKINTSDASIMWATASAAPGQVEGTIESIPDPTNFFQDLITQGLFAWIDVASESVFICETQSGALSFELWDSIGAVGQVWADSVGAILFWGSLTNIMDNQWGAIVVDAAIADAVPLVKVVQDIAGKVGLDGSQIDVTGLKGINVEGYLLEDQMNAADAIRPLSMAFLFDVTESDQVLKFVPRGLPPIATIPQNDLSYMDKKLNILVQEDRQQETDVPNQISITFLDPNRDFQASTQYFRRPSQPYPVMYSKNPRTEQIPIVMEATAAKQLAETMLFMQWANRVAYKVKLPWRYLPYDTTDVMTLTLPDGSTVDVRTVSINIGADLTMEHMSVAETAPVYNPNSTAFGGQFPQNLVMPPSSTRLFLLDMPFVRDVDSPGQTSTSLYYALGAYNTNWPGGSVFSSATPSNFQVRGTSAPPGTSWGITTTILGNTDHPFALDTVNTVTVAMTTGGASLASCTFLEMCNGQNVAALYNPVSGTVEIIQFQTVTQNADGTYTLSNLARGRRGTEVYTGNHGTGDLFIPLSTSTTQVMSMPLSLFNAVQYYAAVSIGMPVNAVTPIAFTDTMRTLKPYAPVQVAAVYSGADIDLTWLRRTRLAGAVASNGGTDRAPLSEDYEAYSVDIYDGDTVVRTLNVNYGADSALPQLTPGVTYTFADQIADFGEVQSSLTLAVYQISGEVGRGFGTIETIEVEGSPEVTFRYYGVSSNTSLDNAEVLALTVTDNATDYDLAYTYDCSATVYPYFCFPASYGTPSAVMVNGLPFSDFTVTVQNVTADGVTTSYNVIRFNNIQTGSAIPVVWA